MSRQQIVWGVILLFILVTLMNMTFRIDKIVKPIFFNIKKQYSYIKRIYKSINYGEVRRDIKKSLRELKKLKDLDVQSYY